MFELMEQPNIHGYSAQTPSGLDVEVVQCYEGQWDLFITRGGDVVACSIDAYRQWQHGYAPKPQVMAVARTLINL